MSGKNFYNIKFNNELNNRREKLNILRKKTIAFPNDFRRKNKSNILHINYDKETKSNLKKLNIKVSVAGRMVMCRIMGKSSFIILQDDGGRIQLYINKNDFVKDFYNEDLKKWDLGDILGAKGILFKTQTDELSIYCYEIRLLVKSIRPLPDKFHGLIDKEIRYRQRYLDLITNDISLFNFKIRSKIISNIRNIMFSYDFLEVETPMLQMIPGGALARPFITHHNSLNMNMYLRVSPELYLKRLIVGGFERIFEINRNFRNEGISPRHNPEFTMMELYMAYSDYKDLMHFTENLLFKLAKTIIGNTQINYGDKIISFEKPFIKLTMKESIYKYCSLANLSDLDSLHKAKKLANKLNIKIDNNYILGNIIIKIFEEIVEKNLIQPTFITEYPIEGSPLARCNDKNPDVADRFELFINGYEIGNGFSELNDPEEQKIRFQKQINNKNINFDENQYIDEDFIIALEHGLPPTAGIGIGIDRLIMLFTNTHNIRDIILFPTMRPTNMK